MRNTPLLCLVLVAFGATAGCGASDFAGQHALELQKDCSETLRCMSGSIVGEGSDTMEKCVAEGGEKLEEASESQQQEFVNAVARCGLLQICDYVSCTQTDPNAGYAALHREDVISQCQQLIGCQIQMGQSTVKTAVDDCIAQTANQLNFGTSQQQQQFEAKALKCRGKLNCDWVNCT